MTTLVLVRHCQSAPSPDLPERDWPLSESGAAQAQALPPALAELGVDVLVSSPYRRAVETLRPYAEQAGLPIAIDEDLRERHLGGWLPEAADVEAAIANMHADPDFSLEGGETGRACLARVDAALRRVLEAHPGRTIAVGSHGGVIGHLLNRLSAAPLPERFWRRIRNPHLFVLDAGEAWVWRSERTFDGTGGVRGA